VLVAGCGGTAGRPSPREQASELPSRFAGNELDPPLAPPDFALRDQDGKIVRAADQGGRYWVAAFLYTGCPDVCPLIASNLNSALRKLPPAQRDRVRVLAISVDPNGDTPQAIDRYVAERRLLPQFRYLGGTRAQLAPVWRGFHISVSNSPDEVSHSAYELLVDPQGRGRVLYDAQVTAAQVLHDLRVLMRK
jgi:protein SCO1/2